MLKQKLFLFVFSTFFFSVCTFTQAELPVDLTKTGSSVKSGSQYVWQEIKRNAEFPESYGFPVFKVKGKLYVFHYEGTWTSTDGATWTKIALPSIRQGAHDTRYIQFNDAVYALGQNEGNYLDGIRFSSKIRRTTDFKNWETVAEKSELPDRVFHGLIVFGGKMWLMGGYDGKKYHNDIWNSTDGVRWKKVVERAEWSPRNLGVFEFKNRFWIFGGGVIDGHREINPDSHKEIWTSEDGIKWTKTELKSGRPRGGTPVVFDNKLWFVGGNRNDGDFDSAVFVSTDGVNWQSQSAPWTPRGAVVVWVMDDKLFITGGKYSYRERNGEIKFVYSNDVWAISRKKE